VHLLAPRIMSNFDIDRSLQELKGDDWGPPAFDSHLVSACHRLQHVPLRELTTEDLRILIGQGIGLPYLVRLALDRLRRDALAAGDFYEGDLREAIVRIDGAFWREHPELEREMATITAKRENGAAIGIRAYQPSDASACHALRRAAFLGAFGEFLSPEEAQAGADSYDAAEYAARIGGMTTWVAVRDRAIVGFCAVRVHPQARAEVAYLYVGEEHRGAGLGSRLLRHAEKYISEAHPDLAAFFMDTVVPKYNQGFWERMGYRVVGKSGCEYLEIKARGAEARETRGEGIAYGIDP
jgi:ribosomal protein S18 acetylase RimI-like enzyme